MGTNDERDPLYPRHAGGPLDVLMFKCQTCMGRGRLGDDWCRPCFGRGFHTNSPTPALLELTEAIGNAAAELTELRTACAKALAALRGVMPYFSQLPAETEQYVRRAVKTLQELARG
jgi:hypothetical protein